MGDDALFRRLYPEWTGDTGPLITCDFCDNIDSNPFFVLHMPGKNPRSIFKIWKRIRRSQQLNKDTSIGDF